MATLPCGTTVKIEQFDYVTAEISVVSLYTAAEIGVVCLMDGETNESWWASISALADDLGSFLADEDGNILGEKL